MHTNRPVFNNAVITIGTFDGVHLGHRQIISRLKEAAKNAKGESVIITFNPHPRNIIPGQQDRIRIINTLDEKITLLEKLGVDHLVVIPFTPSFARQTAEEYIRDFLVSNFHPHTIIIGYDHRFGKNRAGDYHLLEKMAPVYHYQLQEITAHEINEVKISSTRIRVALLDGDMDTANQLLGYTFFFNGKVVHGDKLGRQLGYPTANIAINDADKIVPADGVYAVWVRLNEQTLKGMMSIGDRPTVEGKKRVIEVNIFDFDEDIYDKNITVYVIKYLRPQIKYEDVDSMVAQIHEDKKASLHILEAGFPG